MGNVRDYTSKHGGRDEEARDIYLLFHMFVTPFDLLKRYDLEEERLMSWLGAIADQYAANPYHNWAHAMDVTQFCYFTLTTGQGGRYFNFQDILALLCASIAHDVGHPGYNASFLVRTHHELALR